MEQDLKLVHDFKQLLKVLCSQEVLQSVLPNLISNAIKYKKQGTSPELFLQSVILDEFIILRATDKGIGINLDKHGERLFNPYQRFQPTIEGKDLGLYLIKTQVEKMGGKISVESNVNEGTTFSIYFRQNP